MTLLTVEEVAGLAKVHADTIRRWCKEGTLPAYKLPSGHWRVDPREYQRWLQTQRPAPTVLTPSVQPDTLNGSQPNRWTLRAKGDES